MGQVRFRMYLDNAPASKEQLDEVEEISVDQEMDKVWEARIVLPSYTDSKGVWGGAHESFVTAFGRVRVELDPGGGVFVPLIDGPIVGVEHDMSDEPDESSQTAIVQDDSVYLSRNDTVRKFENKLDHEIARDIYGQASQIAQVDVDSDTPAPTDGLPPVEMQSRTEMQLLRRLAARHGMYAGVFPGKQPGASIGVFKPLPAEPDGLPPLILKGKDRNVSGFYSRNDAQAPAEVSAFSVSLTDKKVVKGKASSAGVQLLGAEPAAKAEVAKRMLAPGGDGVDAQTRAWAAASKLSFAYDAAGSVIGSSYGAVLTPYRVVTAQGLEEKLSGNYLIKSVQHRLTDSEYTQSFGLVRNAVSSPGGGLGALLGGIF